MWSLPEEALFGHFVTTLNNAFDTELAQEVEGYESGSESFNIPTPPSRVPRVYNFSTMEELFFDPANFGQSLTTPEHHEEPSPQGDCCTPTPDTEQYFTDSDNVAWDDDITSSEEHFSTALLHHIVWPEDPILDRHLYIHRTPHKPNLQCSYHMPIQKHNLQDGLATIYTIGCSSILL